MIDKFSKQKDKLIDELIEGLRSDVSKLQDDLFLKVMEDLITKLETTGGKLTSSRGNVILSSREIDEIVKVFNETVHTPFALDFANNTNSLVSMNAGFYRDMLGSSARLTTALNKASELTEEMLGLNTQGNIRPGGYLDGLINDTSISSKIKEVTRKSILSNESVADFRKTLEVEILGGDRSGLLDRHYRTFAYDTVASVDRSYNKVIADEVGLDFAFYSEGLVSDSRPFCVARAGKVFTREEVESWNNLGDWQGRIPGQPVEIVAGGYNCMHSLNWISKEIAIQYRPELADG